MICHLFEADEITCNALISAMEKASRWQAALKLLDDFRRPGSGLRRCRSCAKHIDISIFYHI